jgi:hypothetical protein
MELKNNRAEKHVEDQEDAGKVIWGQVEPLRCIVQENQVKYER